MKSILKIIAVSSLVISFSSLAHDKMKQEESSKMHKEHMKCMNKTGKSMEECMQMMEDSKIKKNKDKKTQKKSNY